ncbi:MAG: 30S ribosomal protein S2 [Candidatus Nanoarchaeia archaeon]|nr:30S ribosomal protein S2 [Candidatus Nanoarchaeia archaeon]
MAEEQLLIPLDTYLKVGLHIGTKFRTKYMEPFIYKVRPDGLAVMNVKKISERIELAGRLLSQYEPKDVIILCRRENGWKPVALFSKITGIKAIMGRYKPGLLTNPDLEDFSEAKLVLAVDPWPDKNAIMDAVETGVTVIALCDTNNEATFVDLVVPCNNKGKKSIALIFWLLAKEIMKNKGILKEGEELKESLEDFTPE